MDTKKYFHDNEITIVDVKDAAAVEKDAESFNYVSAHSKEKNRFIPHVDFTSASNFAFFGSAEQYYEDTIKRIYQTYPYDGSLHEKTVWHLSSSYFDNYIFENEYPRTNGYINLVSGTLRSVSDKYGSGSSSQYIIFRGGPHPSDRGRGQDILDKTGGIKSGFANYFDQGENRESNLKIDGADGNTVEFWLKKALQVPDNYREVVFDTYTANATNDNSLTSEYGRLRVELAGVDASTSPWLVTYLSGTQGFTTASIGSAQTEAKVVDDKWHHYAFVFENSGSNLTAKLYVDGVCEDTITGSHYTMANQATTTVDYVSGGMYATIGALATAPSGTTTPALGWGPLSASLDEFRFWKTARTPEQVGRHWFSQVGAGANTDTANTDLGVYYKFNEGITTNANLDKATLDYSGRISNGSIVNYTSTCRSTGSAIVLSTAASASSEFKDPILYSMHPDVDSFLTASIDKGKYYDYNNNASIYNSMPAWIVDDDSSKELKKLTQIIASYFDTLQLQIQELPKLKNINYPTGSFYKPYPFIDRALESKGFTVAELFPDATIIEQFLNRSEKELFEEKLYNVKNKIYQNIYNVITNIYKSKGTEKAFRNLIRCFGVDRELLKLNLYGNQVTYTYDDNLVGTTTKKNCVNFNHTDRYSATIYQFTSSTNANAVSYISGNLHMSGTKTYSFPFTTEAEVIFPRGTSPSEYAFSRAYNELTSSLFGAHTALQPQYAGEDSDLPDLGWESADPANFQVYAIRKTTDDNVIGGKGYTNRDAYFKLTGTAGTFLETSGEAFPELTSSVFRDIYDNRKWNFAVRVKPTKYPLAGHVSGSQESSDSGEANTYTTSYTVEFYGVNTDTDIVSNEFLVSGTISKTQGEQFLSSSKRLYAGAHRTNFTGTLRELTDVKFSSLRCWLDYLDNQTIKMHARDPHNYGRIHPYKPAYLFEVLDGAHTSGMPYVPQIETLALNWDFTGITGSNDGNGDAYYAGTSHNASFVVPDMSSGSLSLTKGYANIGRIVDTQHVGRGDFFIANDSGSISKEYLYVAQQNPPENLHSSDLVKILKRDDTVFKSTTLPVTHFFALEKSMYQTITEEMLKLFASIINFNSLVGHSVNRYRQDYKELGKVRQLFFEKYVEEPVNEIVYPDLEKYIDYYKWIDTSISKMIQQIVPASSRFAEEIRNMVESHMLERNKYWTKFPTLKLKGRAFKGKGRIEDPGVIEGGIDQPPTNHKITLQGGNIRGQRPGSRHMDLATLRITKNFLRHAESPLAPGEANKKFRLDRSEEDAMFKGRDRSTDNAIDTARQKIFEARIRAYSGHMIRNHFNIDGPSFPIHGGVNSHINKKTTLFRTLIDNKVAGSEDKGLEITTEISKENNYDKEVRETARPESTKTKRHFETSRYKNRYSDDADTGYFGDTYSKFVAPFSLFSSSVTTGYNARIIDEFKSHSDTYGVDFSNLHQDVYAPSYEVPMQGPFTEKWVGGLQYRHNWSQFHKYADAGVRSPDNRLDRPEGWLLNFNSDSDGKYVVFTSPASSSVHLPRALYYREEHAKRPVNIKNIRATTGSEDHRAPAHTTKIGNFSHDYEIVQTSGRGVNKRWFVKNEGYTVALNAHQNPEAPALPLSGVVDFTALDRSVKGTNKSVFVERFNAPGGPETMCESFLDHAAGEKSVYNALPYRNLLVRLPLQELLTNHSKQFGLESDTQYSSSWKLAIDTGFKADGSYPGTSGTISACCYETSASFHKVNRNPRRRVSFVTSSGYTMDGNTEQFVSGVVYDNYWVQHAIPRSDRQYSWITASISPIAFPILGFGRPDARVANGASTDITFLSASEYGSVILHGSYALRDFGVDHSHYLAKKTDSASPSTDDILDGHFLPTPFNYMVTNLQEPVSGCADNTLGYPLGTAISNYYNPQFVEAGNLSGLGDTDGNATILNNLLLKRNGPYQYPSWKQIRNEQNPIVKKCRKNNIYSLLYNKTISCFTESVATTRYFPMVHLFDDSESPSPFAVKHTYGNELCSFANSDINKKISYSIQLGNQPYDKLKKMYINNTNEDSQFSGFYYKEAIWPKETNYFLAKNRMRQNYVVDFWRDEREDRARYEEHSSTNSQNISISKQSIWCLDARNNFTTTAPSTGGLDGAGELMNNYTIFHGVTNPLAVDIKPAAIYARPVSSSSGNRSYCDSLWEVTSSRNPFYDSYADYSEEIRRVGKDFSIIPEYRISDHMSYYVDQKAGNFFVKENEGFLTLTGALHGASNEDGFFREYAHSDFLKHFATVIEDHKGTATPRKFALTCKGIKKFIPYDGFYPATRTLQLATLFSASYSEHDGIEPYQRRIALAPFFAPGILYNTIKAGVAVDYPIYTSLNNAGAAFYSVGNTGNSTTLNPYRLSQSFDYRIPFDALVRPEKYVGPAGATNRSIYEAEPDPHARFTNSSVLGANTTGSVKLNTIESHTYKLAMHNFLAESINFFLKDSSLTTAASLPESDVKFGVTDSEKTQYRMRVLLTDTPAFQSQTRKFSMYNRASAFGPPVDGDVTLPGNKAGYAPFTPPYWYTNNSTGGAYVDLIFNPWKETSNKYTLNEIVSNLTQSFYRVVENDASTNHENVMHITASINIHGRTRVKKVEYEALTGRPLAIQDSPSDDLNVWTIQPRFETPILNFVNATPTDPASGDINYAPSGIVSGPGGGMWHQDGTIESDESLGIFMGIQDSTDFSDLGSLADLVGFKTGYTKLGKLPHDNEITMKEAVVAIPLTKKINKRTGAMERTFIPLDKKMVFQAKNAVENAIPLEQAGTTESIYKMVSAMKKYVIPPRFDFLTKMDKPGLRKKAQPFSMYIFEFEQAFSQQDIANIWQNILPDSGVEFKVEDKTVCHLLGENELLSEEHLADKDLYWMVFKVKQKAATNYFKKTADSSDDDRFAFDFNHGAGDRKFSTPDYSYNWPYDFCSLVELARIESEVKFENDGEAGTEVIEETTETVQSTLNIMPGEQRLADQEQAPLRTTTKKKKRPRKLASEKKDITQTSGPGNFGSGITSSEEEEGSSSATSLATAKSTGTKLGLID